MTPSEIPLEIDAQLPPAALEDLTRVLRELGYDPRPGPRTGEGGGPGAATLWLRAGSVIEPEAANVIIKAVADWIHRRPAPKQRFGLRRGGPRPITVTIFGPNGEQVASTEVRRD